MNTILSASRVALVALALGTAGVTATFAQTTNTPSTTAPACTGGGWHHHHHDNVLTSAERAQLKKAREQALASNGTLQTEQASLKQQFETLQSAGSTATKDQWQALHQQKEKYHQDLKAAELLADPTLGPIFTKLEAAHQDRHHSNT